MKKAMLVSGLLFCFLFNHAQKLQRNRQQLLSNYHTAAIKEQKSILLFSSTSKNTKEQDAIYIGKLERKEVHTLKGFAVYSKYLGETEKNLNRIFDEAVNKHWILFFDEADELFGSVKEPEVTIKHIQDLAPANNVLTIFWCEDDCLKWLKRSRYILVQ